MKIRNKFNGTVSAIAILSSVFSLSISSLPAMALPATCSGSSIAIDTNGQYWDSGQTLTVTFRGVGKYCAFGNFKMIVADKPTLNGQGLLSVAAVTTNIALETYPDPSGTTSQTVTFTKTFASADESKFFQFYTKDASSNVRKSVIVAVYPAGYHEPTGGVVGVSITSGSDLPYYDAALTGLSAFGDIAQDHTWYNCGAPSSSTAQDAIGNPATAEDSCDVINSGGYSYFRGDLTGARPNDITDSIIVARIIASDNYGRASTFFSAAVNTSTYGVTEVSLTSAYIGGGETFTVTGYGLTRATVMWTPNVGDSTLLQYLNVSDTQTVFEVPAPKNRNATSATISIRPVGGFISWPNSITLLKSNVKSLTNLQLSSGTLNPSFSSDQLSYSATVLAGTNSLTVRPTFIGYGQIVTVNSTPVLSGVASGSITIARGSNTITLLSTAENGETRTYTVSVTRPLAPFLDTPTVTMARATSGVAKSVDLAWGAITGSSSYTVKIYDAAGTALLKTIAGTSGTSLTINTGNYPEIGGTIHYKFSVTAIGDVENFRTSAESALSPIGSVTISSLIGDSAFEGRQVSASSSSLPAGTYTYQWFSGSDSSTLTAISGATTLSYTPKASDRSYADQMYLAVRATLNTGTYSYTSTAIPVYTYPNATGGSVTSDAAGTYLSGKYKVGQTVYGHPWSVMGTPWPTLTYQWWICNTSAATATPSASGCTASTSGTSTRAGGYDFSYVVPSTAAGKFLTFTASLSNAATTAQGSVFTLTQSRTMNSGLVNSAPGLSATPTISGTGAVGVRLTASALTYVGTPTGKISYQWWTSSSELGTYSAITNARSLTYTPVIGDLNQWLKVVATATSNAGETATDASVTAVQILQPQATLSITNSVRTGTVGTSITVTASGGSGSGALNYSVTGTGCSIILATGVLSANQATTCTVTAKKLASTGYNEVSSAVKRFTFTN